MSVRSSYEMHVNDGKLNEETLADHENLLDQYQSLDATLQELREEFDQFLNRTRIVSYLSFISLLVSNRPLIRT